MSEAISPTAHDDSLLPPLSAENNHTLGTKGLLMLSQSRKIHPENTCKWRKEKSGFVFCFLPSSSSLPLNDVSQAETACPAPAGRGPWRNLASTASSVPTAPILVLLVNRMCGQILVKVNSFWLSQGRKLFSRSGRKLFSRSGRKRFSRSIRKQPSIPRMGLCIKHKGSYISSNTRFPMTTWTKHSGVSLQPQGAWEAAFLQLTRLVTAW